MTVQNNEFNTTMAHNAMGMGIVVQEPRYHQAPTHRPPTPIERVEAKAGASDGDWPSPIM